MRLSRRDWLSSERLGDVIYIYIGAEIKNEHMRESGRGKKRNGRSAGGRPQSGDKPYVAASPCRVVVVARVVVSSRGRSVVSVVARTFGLLLLPFPYPPPPPLRLSISTCASVSGRAPLGLYRISPRSKHRERRWEKEIGSRRLALVWRVSLRLFRTVRTVALSSLSRSSREARMTRKSRGTVASG